MEQVLPESHAGRVDADLSEEEPGAANEVPKRLVSNDALHAEKTGEEQTDMNIAT